MRYTIERFQSDDETLTADDITDAIEWLGEMPTTMEGLIEGVREWIADEVDDRLVYATDDTIISVFITRDEAEAIFDTPMTPRPIVGQLDVFGGEVA